MLKDRAELKRNEGFQCPLYAEEILSCSEINLESIMFAHETAQISGETCDGSISWKTFIIIVQIQITMCSTLSVKNSIVISIVIMAMLLYGIKTKHILFLTIT